MTSDHRTDHPDFIETSGFEQYGIAELVVRTAFGVLALLFAGVVVFVGVLLVKCIHAVRWVVDG